MRQRVAGPQWINDVRAASIARRRTLSYSRTTDRKIFMIDGRVVDEARTDQTVKLGDTEEWTVVNTDQQYRQLPHSPDTLPGEGGKVGFIGAMIVCVTLFPYTARNDQGPG